MELVVERYGYGPNWTIGVLLLATYTWPCCEQPWNDNIPKRSCIPLGTFDLVPCMYYHGDGPGGKKDYPTFEIVGVPGRSLCKIHVANKPSQLEGCIAPGRSYATFEQGMIGVAFSQNAFDEWYEAMKRFNPKKITVRDSLKVVRHTI